MLAVVKKTGEGYTARFERRLKHSVEKVWASLTKNEKLAQWFGQLQIQELRPGGIIRFDMKNGTFEELEILEVKEKEVLEYTWGKDRVRFELYPEGDGCRLVLIETIVQMTGHTPKDLAGWQVCLGLLEAAVDGQPKELDKSEWEVYYAQYEAELKPWLEEK
ncbi:SRPBCC family protein [Paenibacillus aurantius]|uniref:SRPBCC family protein n=1 Tax=Paenibacillus aurantius TaxID=2918900 RepID=A0AA96LEZ3_9BACL|nr:SRPBCC family protein [Paenibacillus aurantius]WNQ12023.1 SRPBCC family protein [Paenibacillus aurantius]